MANKKIERYKKLLSEATIEDWKYLIKYSFVNSQRQYHAAWKLYEGHYREQSYNLFYVSAEELYKCISLLKQLSLKENHQDIDATDLDELAKLFVYHIFKIEGSKDSAVKNLLNKRMIVKFMDKPHLNGISEGKKMKDSMINSMTKYSSNELFDKKNESIYTGYRENIDELINPIDNFHFELPNIMMKIINELQQECKKQVIEIFGKEEIDRLLNYKMLIGTKHSE